MPRSLRRLPAAALLVFVAACGGDAAAPTSTSEAAPVGTTSETTATTLPTLDALTDRAIDGLGSDADAAFAVLNAADQGYDLTQIVAAIKAGTLQADGSIEGMEPGGVATGFIQPDPLPEEQPTPVEPPVTTTTLEDGVLLRDQFDTADIGLLFEPSHLSLIVTFDQELEMRSLTPGVLVAVYPDPIPDGVAITLDLVPLPASESTAAFGAFVLAEDPSTPGLDHYVAIWANPSDGLLTVAPWNLGWEPVTSEPIPAGVGLAAGEWVTMRLVLDGGEIEVYLNDILVLTWSGPTPVTEGYWGPVIASNIPGDGMRVDNVLVEEGG